MVIDVLERDDLPFPRSLPEFQRLFPDGAACAAYLERARWGDGSSALVVERPAILIVSPIGMVIATATAAMSLTNVEDATQPR